MICAKKDGIMNLICQIQVVKFSGLLFFPFNCFIYAAKRVVPVYYSNWCVFAFEPSKIVESLKLGI